MDFDYIETTNCDGVGLYRTEIPFMASEAMPDVGKQVSYYKDLMDRCGTKESFSQSGRRFRTNCCRIGLIRAKPTRRSAGARSELRLTGGRFLRQQIRAFLLSAAGKELNVMFPMISDLAEFEDAKETLLIELEKDKSRGLPVPKKVNIGLMIEVPSVVFQLDDILPRADFVSVGTNDLAQFIFACDRGNPKLSERYDVLSAPFLNVMKTIVDKSGRCRRLLFSLRRNGEQSDRGSGADRSRLSQFVKQRRVVRPYQKYGTFGQYRRNCGLYETAAEIDPQYPAAAINCVCL